MAAPMAWDEQQAYEELLYWDRLIQEGHRLLPHDFDRYVRGSALKRPTGVEHSSVKHGQTLGRAALSCSIVSLIFLSLTGMRSCVTGTTACFMRRNWDSTTTILQLLRRLRADIIMRLVFFLTFQSFNPLFNIIPLNSSFPFSWYSLLMVVLHICIW